MGKMAYTASELAISDETAHLLRSLKNAERLLTALHRARSRVEEPSTLEELRQGLGLGDRT